MMNKKGQCNIEEIFKGFVGVVFMIIFMSALAPLLVESNVFGLSSWLIGFGIFAVIVAFLISVLNELGVNF